MPKRINLQVDKIISKQNKKIKEQPGKAIPEKHLSFEQLYQMARKASAQSKSRMISSQTQPMYSSNTSQQTFQSLKNSRQTPQNTNRQASRVSQKLNRSLETKREDSQKVRGSVRSFSGGKYQSSQKCKIKHEKQTNFRQQKSSVLNAKKPKEEVNTQLSETSLFESEFLQQINKLDHSQHEHVRQTECFLSIEETYQIMKGLHYLRKIEDQKYFVKIWQELEGEGYGGVPSGNLYQFCSYINHYSPTSYYQKPQKSGSNGGKKIMINGNLKIVASESSKLEIYEQYLALRVNRILYGNTATDYSGGQKTLHRTSNIKIIDDDPQPAQKQKQQTNSSINQKRKISFKKKEIQENGVQNPIKRTVRLKSAANPKTKKVQQVMKWQDLEKYKIKQQDSGNEGLDTKQSKNNLTSNQSESSINSSEVTEQAQQRKPLLSIDVNLGEGVSQKLVVYEGQSAAQVSQRLVQKYKIDDSLRMKFEGMLSGHLRNLLWRIQQVSEDMFSDRQQ